MGLLTSMQQRYIWIAGSYPSLVVVQGRGYRSPQTMYNVDEDAGELTIFGYSYPLEFLARRGLFRMLQDHGKYALTEAGEAAFAKMVASHAGDRLNPLVKAVELKRAKPIPEEAKQAQKTKICSVCGVEKFFDEYHPDTRVIRDGRAACCRTCIKGLRSGKHKKHRSAPEDPEKRKARIRLKDAVRRGIITKPDECQKCGATPPKNRLDGHHHDYSKPLEVTWLCRPCHGLEHLDPKAKEAQQRRLLSLEGASS